MKHLIRAGWGFAALAVGSMAAAGQPPAPTPPATPGTPTAPATTAPPTTPAPPAEPTPQDTIRDLERQANKPAPTAPAVPMAPAPTATPAPAAKPGEVLAITPTGAPLPTPSAGATHLLREGTFLASRRGRMIRGADGQWALAFDADRAGKAEPTMTLMPCLNLQAMEKMAERGGEALSFTISGQVFVYKGRNYLLSTLYVVNRRAELSPAG